MENSKPITKFSKSYVIKMSDDSEYLVHIGAKTHVYHVNSMDKVITLDEVKYPFFVQFSINNDLMIIKGTRRDIAIYDVTTWTCVRKLKAMKNSKAKDGDCYITHDSKYIIDCVNEISYSFLFVLNMEDGKVIFERKFEDCIIKSIEFEADSKTYSFIIYNRGSITNNGFAYTSILKWKYPFGENVIEEIDFNKKYQFNIKKRSMANNCYALYNNDELVIMNNNLNDVIKRKKIEKDHCYNLDWTNNGEYLLIVLPGVLRIFRYSDLTCIKEYYEEYLSYAQFTPDGRHLLIGTWENGYYFDLEEFLKIDKVSTIPLSIWTNNINPFIDVIPDIIRIVYSFLYKLRTGKKVDEQL